MLKKKIILSGLLLANSFSVLANNEAIPYSGLGITYSADKRSEGSKDYFGLELLVGIHINDEYAIEAGIGDYTLATSAESVVPIFSRFKNYYSLGQSSNLYWGSGVAYIDTGIRPLINLGIEYSLNEKWTIDAGYQGLFGVNNYHDDVYSMRFLAKYQY